LEAGGRADGGGVVDGSDFGGCGDEQPPTGFTSGAFTAGCP
jgi:hypothetical protein